MTIASLVVFEDTGVDFAEILEAVGSRVHLVPRFRRRLMKVLLGQGRPVLVDDEHFDLRFHIRHAGLPRPGGWQELLDFASRIFSLPLDERRPLWEMWIVDMPDDRKAVIQKTHHCLVDGMSAVDIASVLFDRTREGPVAAAPPQWEPQPAPSPAALLRDSVIDGLAMPLRAAGRLWGAVRNPRETVERGVEIAGGLESFSASSLSQTSSTSLDRHVGEACRRLETVSSSLATIREVKSRLGATVNDVVLAVVAGGLGHLLRSRGEDTAGRVVRAVIPVSTRTEDQHFTYGNMIAAMVADLPVGEEDPIRRLQLVQECMSNAKTHKQSTGVDFIAHIGDFAPASLIAFAGRVAVAQPFYSLVVTNVPGPQVPLYFVGGEILDAFFFGPNLVQRTDLAVAVLSYNGHLNFGLTADWDTVPDVKVFARGVEASLQELIGAD